MTVDEVTEVVRAAIVRVLEVPAADVGRESTLVGDLGADSLALVEIADIVEESLAERAAGVVFDDYDLERLVTVGDAVDYLVVRL